MTVTLYGIKNCDTMRKAQDWLIAHEIAYDFHDYKKSALDSAKLEGWCRALGWEVVINRAGQTFRKLDDAQKQDLDEVKAIELMLGNLSMIKRPVLDKDGKLLVGFKPELYAEFFA
ncbi:arsenate reductase [Pseudochrobactrum sp. MP213Fo]|uniref:arsenate reductase n=1 Tax=Pseudochrobactrum sp. MP213Fo TaxID=3022250 RepID=UPI003BA2313E